MAACPACPVGAEAVQIDAGVETMRLLRDESQLAGRLEHLEHLEATYHDCGGDPGDLHLVAALQRPAPRCPRRQRRPLV